MYLANIIAEIELNPWETQKLFLAPLVSLIFGSAKICYYIFFIYFILHFIFRSLNLFKKILMIILLKI